MPEDNQLAPHVQEIARALNNRIDMEQIEDELKRYVEYGVPLDQAKRDIVRNHGGRSEGGSKKIKDLVAGDSGVDLVAKVLTVNPKDITVKGQPKTIYYGFLADDTAKVPYTAWKDHGFERGTMYTIGNVYVKQGYRGDGVEINIGDYARVGPSDVEMDVVDAGVVVAAAAGGPVNVVDLIDGMGSVTLTGRVLDAREKTITTANGTRSLIEGELADATGRVVFTCWAPAEHGATLTKGAVVKVENAYVKAFRGTPNLNFGEQAKVTAEAADALPGADELGKPRRLPIAVLERTGGATGALVEGVVLEVKKGSGLISRCPTCNRVLQKRECRVHGRVEGTPDLRIKGVLDDGTGVLTFFLGREATEKLLDKSLEECQKIARDAMDVDVIQDDLAMRLTARRLGVVGNASSDEFGLQVIATEARPPSEIAVQAEAEKLLAKVEEITAEVA